MQPAYSRRYLWAGYYGKKLMFLLHRNPSFGDQYVRELERAEAAGAARRGTRRRFAAVGPASEIEHFRQSSFSRLRSWSLALMAVFLVHLARDMVVQVMDYRLVDRSDLRANLHQHIAPLDNATATATAAEPTTRFACLATNCSRLSPGRPLALDMGRLPYFKLCVPHLSSYYSSIVLVDPMALLTFTTVAFAVILVSVMSLIWNLVTPFEVQNMMFFVAPTIVTNLSHRALGRHLAELNQSWANFVGDQLRWGRPVAIKQLPGISELTTTAGLTCRAKRSLSGADFGAADGYEHLAATWRTGPHEPAGSDADAERDYLDECLPAVRTDWWRVMLARAYLLLAVLMTAFTSTCFRLVLAFLDRRAAASRALYRAFAREMRRAGCAIWAELGDGDSGGGAGGRQDRAPVDLAGGQAVEWNLWTGSDLALSYVLMFSIAVLIVSLLVILLDMQCWLSEILDAARFAVQMLHQLDLRYNLNAARPALRDLRRIPADRYHRRSPSSVCVERVRREFMRATELGLLYSSAERRDFGAVLKSAAHLFDDEEGADADAAAAQLAYETLEKYYLNVRLFIGYMDEQERVVMMVALITYPLNYGAALLCVFHVRRTHSFGIEPIMIITIGMLISNTFILMPAHFNAKVKRLEPLVWSLVARLTLRSHPRLRHLRVLWTKVAVLLENRAGLVAARSIKLNYIKLIQLVIWTLSLVLLAVR